MSSHKPNVTSATMGNLNRRQVLQGATALGASAALAGLAPLSAKAETPQRGGTLRIGMSRGSTTDTLDPTTFIDAGTYMIGYALGDNVTEWTGDKRPIPELAESWDVSDDAKVWTFHLHKGVEFHNGKTLTSADVVYSLNLHRGEDTKSSAKGFLLGVSDIRADGPNTLVIEHETGDGDVPNILGDFHFPILPEGHTDFANFVGTGPYVLESFEPGVKFRATRNPNYWRDDRGWVDEVEVVYITDPAARSNALVTGEVDVISEVEPKTAKLMTRQPGVRIIESLGGAFRNFEMDVRHAQFQDVNVREAVKYGVDREQILQKVFSGYGAIANDHPIAPNDQFYNTELPQRPYDPDKAKWHLKQAGLDSIDIELSAADTAFPGAVDAAVLIQEASKSAGINYTVKREPNDGYWSNVWMVKPMVMSGWGTRPTPGMMFSLAFKCGANWNSAYWCNERFDKLLVAGQTETNFEKRRDIYWEMQEICANDGGFGVFAYPAYLDGYTDRVQGIEPDANQMLSGARIIERAWMTS